MKIRFGLAGATDTRLNQCAGCHHVFGGMRAFDMHRLNFKCQDPASIGLVVSRRAMFATAAGRIQFDVWSRPVPATATMRFPRAGQGRTPASTADAPVVLA